MLRELQKKKIEKYKHKLILFTFFHNSLYILFIIL